MRFVALVFSSMLVHKPAKNHTKVIHSFPWKMSTFSLKGSDCGDRVIGKTPIPDTLFLILLMPASEQGVDFSRYMLIPRVLIFLRRGNSVLLLKGAPTKRLWAGKYNGVGGHVEAGEGILSAAQRKRSWTR